jgi:hypothetical protein
LSTQRLVTWITFLAVFAMAARISVDTDTWWHLRAGQWIVENRQVPREDVFSYTRAGEAWEYPGWLAEVPMYLIYRLAGPGGLNLWTALMVTLTFVFVWQTLSGGSFLKAFVVILAAAAAGVYWAARPYLVTFLLAAITLWVLEKYRWRGETSTGKFVYWLPVLMILWVNSHGGFLVGFLIWGIYWLSELGWIAWQTWFKKQRTFDIRAFGTPLLWAGLLMLLAVCVNPYGPKMLMYPFKTVSIGVLRDYIQEWQTPEFHSISVQPFAWLMLLTFGAVGASRQRLAFIDFALVGLFFYMGLLAGRNVALFSIVAPMVLTRHAAPALDGVANTLGIRFSGAAPPGKRSARLNVLILVLLAAAVVFKVTLIYPEKINTDAFKGYLPYGAVEYLNKDQPEGRLFNSYNWGGYLLWSLPGYPVFVDGRTDLYNDEIVNQWLKVVRVEDGWQDILEEYGINLVLIETDSMLDRTLALDPAWVPIYQDTISVLYKRK